jgi:hypothetical protein
MSGSPFYREHAALMRPGTREDHEHRVQEAYEAVRDKWISEGRYLDLVRVIVANWTSGNCVAFMAPLGAALVEAGEAELHRHLWSRTIKRQVATFFNAFDRIQGEKPPYLRLLNLDTQGFAEGDPASYRNPERAAAFLLQRLTGDLDCWRAESLRGGLATDDPEQIQHCLQRLKVPRIRVNRLSPARVCGAASPRGKPRPAPGTSPRP